MLFNKNHIINDILNILIFTNIAMTPFDKIYRFIDDLLVSDPNITNDKILASVEINFVNTNSDHLPLCFGEANNIDKIFIGKGGPYWRKAYSNPNEGDIFNNEGQTYEAFNCGIFTFDFKLKKDFCDDDVKENKCEKIKHDECENCDEENKKLYRDMLKFILMNMKSNPKRNLEEMIELINVKKINMMITKKTLY